MDYQYGFILLISLFSILSIIQGSYQLKCEDASIYLKNYNSLWQDQKDHCEAKKTCLYSNFAFTDDVRNSLKEDNRTHPNLINCIVFQNSTLTELPKKLLELRLYSYVTGIIAPNSSIKYIDDFSHSSFLRFMDLSHNDLEFLNQPVTKVCEFLDFSHNQIRAIDGKFFGKIISDVSEKGFCHINFSHNKLEKFPLEWFDDIEIPKIHLDFSSNLISQITGNVKKRYSKIAKSNLERSINLANNQLKVFPIHLLEQVPQINVLNLSGNQLNGVKILRQLNVSMYIMASLDLSYNNITNISLNDFGNLTISKLNLSYNKIESLVMDIEGHHKKFFDEIDLSHNLIKKISISVLNSFKVSNIDFSHNFITEFVDSTNPMESEIGIMDLSYNKFRELSIKTISTLNVKNLNLKHNRISNFKDFEEITKIETLNLESNHITEIPFQVFGKSSIKNLLLSNNNVRLRYGIFPKDVELLDLRHNDIQNAHENYFIFYKKLHTLRLEANGIRRNFLTHSLSLSSIKILGIARNPFYCSELVELLKILEGNKVNYELNDHNQLNFDEANINGVACIED